MEHLFTGTAFKHVSDFLADFISTQRAPTQQSHHGMGGPLTHRTQTLQAAFASCTGNLVEHLDQNRETDGGVQVAFWNVEAKAFSGKAETDHHQKAQAQHDHGGVTVDETGQRLAGNDHQANGDHHRDHHHGQMLDHAHCSDHRIQREHRVQHHNLRNDWPEHGIDSVGCAFCHMPLKPFVQFHGGLEQQEQTTKQHDQVAARKGFFKHLEQRLGQRHHPRDACQQAQSH